MAEIYVLNFWSASGGEIALRCNGQIPSLTVKDIERDLDTQAEDCYIAMGALSEVYASLVWFCGVYMHRWPKF